MKPFPKMLKTYFGSHCSSSMVRSMHQAERRQTSPKDRHAMSRESVAIPWHLVNRGNPQARLPGQIEVPALCRTLSPSAQAPDTERNALPRSVSAHLGHAVQCERSKLSDWRDASVHARELASSAGVRKIESFASSGCGYPEECSIDFDQAESSATTAKRDYCAESLPRLQRSQALSRPTKGCADGSGFVQRKARASSIRKDQERAEAT